jgi:hypothetical protein
MPSPSAALWGAEYQIEPPSRRGILYPCEYTQNTLEICIGGMTLPRVFWHDPCVVVMLSPVRVPSSDDGGRILE